MTDTSGPTSCEPFAKWDRDSSCWKTSEATSLWALTLSSLTLPAWGGLHDGELCELPTPELAISEPDSSSLPTPTRADYRTPPTNPGIRNSGSGVMPASEHSLPTKILGLLPTPSAADGMGGHLTRSGERSDEMLLPGIVRTFLPTPAVNDMGRGKTVEDWDAWTDKMKTAHGNGNGHGKSLEIEAMRMLPTPATANSKSTRAMTASTENGRRSGGGQSSPPGLEEMASILSGHWPDHMPPMEELPPATLRSIGATTDPPSPDGNTSSGDPHQHQLSLDVQGIPA